MEHITIKPSDFRVRLVERNKLYNIYGKEYLNELPKIYEKLAKILNSNDIFSTEVYKSLYDNDYCGPALNNISQIFANNNDSALADIYYSITKLLFFDCIYLLLKKHIMSKEPALSDCRGIREISQCDFIIERYHQFINSLNVDVSPTSPTIDGDGNVIINKGDLFHGTTYSKEVVESIAKRGLESGQLHGIAEDGETFLCIDFFKATKDSTAEEICAFGKQYTNNINKIVFVINHENIEGPKALFPDLTEYDAYNEKTERGNQARKFVKINNLQLNSSNAAAILIGVPPSMISSIIVNPAIESDLEKIEFLSSCFPKAAIVSRTTGTVIKKPINNHIL